MSATRRPQRRSEDDEVHIEWSKCLICQNKTKEPLQFSYNAKLTDSGQIRANYSEHAERMLQFKTEGVMPFDVDFNALSGSDDLGQSLYCNQVIINSASYYSAAPNLLVHSFRLDQRVRKCAHLLDDARSSRC